MTASGRQPNHRPSVEWIVCRGAERDVRDGAVACPVAGEDVAVQACLSCRHLAWADGERDRPSTCELDELS
jgi:hypothetical protein